MFDVRVAVFGDLGDVDINNYVVAARQGLFWGSFGGTSSFANHFNLLNRERVSALRCMTILPLKFAPRN